MSHGKRKNLRELKFVEVFLIAKVLALRRISEMLGFIGKLRDDPLPYPDGLRDLLIDRLQDPRALPVQRDAISLMLELFEPDWRKNIPRSVLGYLVLRNSREVVEWREAVFARDGYQCVKCESADELHAHHIVRWVDAPSLRVVLQNGITLCQPCHASVHASGGVYV